MILGIYSDPHVSFTSSILPTYSSDKYSARLQMCIDSFRWMYEAVFYKNNVELICCCGDLTDKYTLRADEITALSECLGSNYEKIPEIHITGNHDMLNTQFYSTSLLKLFNHVQIFSSPTKIDDTLSVIPYMKSDMITHEMLKRLKNEIVLSHLDIAGSHLRGDYIMDTGVDPELLRMYFNLVLNGHLHTREAVKPGVWNIGSLTSGSFSDNNIYVPGVMTYDTITHELNTHDNPHAILFRKIHVSDTASLIKALDKLDRKYNYVMRVTCPYDCKDNCHKILSEADQIMTFRVITDLSQKRSIEMNKNSVTPSIFTERSLESEMLKYLNDNSSLLKYPMGIYQDILSNVSSNDESSAEEVNNDSE